MSIYRNFSLTYLALVSTLALTGCATIFGSREQTLTITSEPSNIPFVVKNQEGQEKFSGHTPFIREFKKSTLVNSYIVFYPGDKEKASGYPLNQSLNPLLFFGILNPLSLIVDIGSGAAFEFAPIFYNAKDSIPNHQEKPPAPIKKVLVPLPSCSLQLMSNFNSAFADPFFYDGIRECTDGFYHYYYDDFNDRWYRSPFRRFSLRYRF